MARPSPVPSCRRVELEIDLREFFENVHQLVGRDADAGVLDANAELHDTGQHLAGDVDQHMARSVNLTALPSRLVTICRKRPTSPTR